MTLLTSQIQLDTWVTATWEEFATVMDDPQYGKNRSYFDNGYMRIEMAVLDRGQARQNSLLSKVISLHATVRNLRLVEFTNCSFYQEGEWVCPSSFSL